MNRQRPALRRLGAWGSPLAPYGRGDQMEPVDHCFRSVGDLALRHSEWSSGAQRGNRGTRPERCTDDLFALVVQFTVCLRRQHLSQKRTGQTLRN